MLSGIHAAEAAHAAIVEGRSGDTLDAYEKAVRSGPIAKDLKPVRNVKPLWSRYGLKTSLMVGGADMWLNTLTGGSSPLGTLAHGKTDAEATLRADRFEPIEYPKPDGVLSFDRLTNVAYSFTNHDENQPSHLVLRDPRVPIDINLPRWAEPAERYCPAGVYEVLRDADGSNPRQVFQDLGVRVSDEAAFRRLLAGEALAYETGPQRLLAAFLLGEDPEGVSISPLAGTDRYRAWLDNSFLLDIEDQALLAQHFDWTHRISGAVPTFTLDYPRDFRMLPEVRGAIRRHAAGIEP